MAQALLTPLISRVLQQFIRSSSEGDAATFRASLAGSSGIALQNLDLNLDSLLRGVPFIAVDRAFAKSLRVNIPWAALGSKPIEVTVFVCRSNSAAILVAAGLPSSTTLLCRWC
jgi:N-terminal region of Chorein or VPS13